MLTLKVYYSFDLTKAFKNGLMFPITWKAGLIWSRYLSFKCCTDGLLRLLSYSWLWESTNQRSPSNKGRQKEGGMLIHKIVARNWANYVLCLIYSIMILINDHGPVSIPQLKTILISIEFMCCWWQSRQNKNIGLFIMHAAFYFVLYFLLCRVVYNL